MTTPPADVLEAALHTLDHALVYTRNFTIQPTADARQINDLMEAIHAIPGDLTRWAPHSFDTLRLHLACFQHTRWPGAPDLVRLFDSRLTTLRP